MGCLAIVFDEADWIEAFGVGVQTNLMGEKRGISRRNLGHDILPKRLVPLDGL